jgi:hypothetical protein
MDKPKIKLSPEDSGKPKINLSSEPKISGGKTTILRRRNNSSKNLLRETIKIAAVFSITGLVFYRFVLPALAPTKNLTGNRSALAMCDWEMTAWKSYEPNRPRFDFYKLSDDQKRRIIMFGLDQDFLVRTNFAWGDAANREIVIVCARVYDNVPVPAPWTVFYRNPAHAVGYSDGTRGLISTEEFNNLFSYGLVPLWTLATNSDSHFKIFKQ